MAANFPTNPSANDTFLVGNIQYIFLNGKWQVNATGVSSVSDVSDLTDNNGLLGGSTAVYSTASNLPTSDNQVADLAFVSDTKSLYIWDGTEWDRVHTGLDNSPIWTTEPPTNIDVLENSTGDNITIEASDPEGFPITYGVDTNPSDQNIADITNNNDGTFTISPLNQGSFIARFNSSDGLHVSSKSSNISVIGLPQKNNLIGWYDFRNTNSYSGTGTNLIDLSTAGNDQVITAGSGSFLSEGAGGVSAYSLATDSRINFTGMITVNTLVLIVTRNTDDNDTVFFAPSGGNNYLGVYSTGTGTLGGGYGWTGMYVNGSIPGSRNQAYPFMDATKFNSWAITGITNVNLHGLHLNNYGSNWSSAYQIQAAIFWDVALTVEEINLVHRLYDNMASWSGA